MRRLVVLVAAIVLVDTMFYGAITPLLPYYSHHFDLSKSSAGLLAAAYAGRHAARRNPERLARGTHRRAARRWWWASR